MEVARLCVAVVEGLAELRRAAKQAAIRPPPAARASRGDGGGGEGGGEGGGGEGGGGDGGGGCDCGGGCGGGGEGGGGGGGGGTMDAYGCGDGVGIGQRAPAGIGIKVPPTGIPSTESTPAGVVASTVRPTGIPSAKSTPAGIVPSAVPPTVILVVPPTGIPSAERTPAGIVASARRRWRVWWRRGHTGRAAGRQRGRRRCRRRRCVWWRRRHTGRAAGRQRGRRRWVPPPGILSAEAFHVRVGTAPLPRWVDAARRPASEAEAPCHALAGQPRV